MEISKTIEIEMGHRLPNHKSKCYNLHGHRYVIKVGVFGLLVDEKGSSDEGMIVDFNDLKEIMMEEINDVYDHGFIMYDLDGLRDIFEKIRDSYKMKIMFVPFIPTAENLAKHWFDILNKKLKKIKIQLQYVKVWETPTSAAVYRGEQ